MLATIAGAWGLLSQHRRRRYVQVAALSLVAAVLEVLAAFAVVALVATLLGDAVELPLVGDPRTAFPGLDDTALARATTVVFAGLLLARSGVAVLQTWFAGRVSEHTSAEVADRLVEGYLSMPYEWHLQRGSAELVRNAWDSVLQVSSGVFQPLARLAAELLVIIGLGLVLLQRSVPLTLAAAGVLVLAGGTTLGLLQPRMRALGGRWQDSALEAHRELLHAFEGVRDVKALGREGTFAMRFRRARWAMAAPAYQRGVLGQLPRLAVDVAFIVVVLVGVFAVVGTSADAAALTTLGVFAYVGLRLQPALGRIISSLATLRWADAAVRALHDGFRELGQATTARRAADDDPTPTGLAGRLELVGVSYAYPAGDLPALDGVDVTVPSGTSLGVVGRTGGGKSTLVDVMGGLLAPTAGAVLVDGTDVGDITRAWRRSIGIVHQSSFVLEDSVRANVAFGIPTEEVDDDRVRTCLATAQLLDEVEALPDGIRTRLGDHGRRLSGGQRQRLTIARALYRDPAVLFLDEATSNLDPPTEQALVTALRALTGITLVTVAHRLSTVRHCDQLLVLEAGRPVAIGTWDDLAQGSAAFQRLVSSAS